MKIMIFGATGMVGRGALRECLRDREVSDILLVSRKSVGFKTPRLQELLLSDFNELEEHKQSLMGYDACFFCLGVSSVGMDDETYKEITYRLTLSVARLLVTLNPQMVFIYVSGHGTDSSERGSRMWARVKGRTENRLLELPFKAKYMFRPGFIQPMHGEVSKVGWVNSVYGWTKPIYPVLRKLLPRFATSTESVGRAMLQVVKQDPAYAVIENDDINRLAARYR